VESFPLLGGAFAGHEGKAGYLILTPEMARLFAEFGPTKSRSMDVFLQRLCEEKSYPLAYALEKLDMMETAWWDSMTEEEKARWGEKKVGFFSPDPFEWALLVAGGPGKGAFYYPRNLFAKGQSLVMREIRLPSHWDELLKESAIEPIPMP
jgi:hypothetical protein